MARKKTRRMAGKLKMVWLKKLYFSKNDTAYKSGVYKPRCYSIDRCVRMDLQLIM